MSKIVIEVDSSDNAALRKIIQQLKNQVATNLYSNIEQKHEERLDEIMPGSEPFLPNTKITSVINIGIHGRIQFEIAGVETLGDLIKMDRKSLTQIDKISHKIVNDLETLLWKVYGKRLAKTN